MKARTKEIIRDGFGSLVSNASALRGAKAGPLWLTIVMFFLGILLPIIPLFVAQANTNGSTFLNNYSFNLEKTVTLLATDLETRNVEFEIDSDHLLTVRENNNVVDYAMYGYVNPFAARVNEKTHQFDLMLYISDRTLASDKQTVNDLISKQLYTQKTTEPATAGDTYRPSYIILFKDGVYVTIVGNNSTTVIANSYIGDFKTMPAANNYLSKLLTVEGVTKDIYSADYSKGVYTNFVKFLDKSYETSKIKNMWGFSGIYLGIYFGVCLLMGLLMFLLTRGKNNPNNYFSLWLCLKIQGRLVFCPGLLTMIIGFFLTNQATLIFIMTVGLRVMWISMKELRPVAQ